MHFGCTNNIIANSTDIDMDQHNDDDDEHNSFNNSDMVDIKPADNLNNTDNIDTTPKKVTTKIKGKKKVSKKVGT